MPSMACPYRPLGSRGRKDGRMHTDDPVLDLDGPLHRRPQTPMTLMRSEPSLPTTSASRAPPRHHPTAPATKACTRCARSGPRCSRAMLEGPVLRRGAILRRLKACRRALALRLGGLASWVVPNITGFATAFWPKLAYVKVRGHATTDRNAARPRLVPRARSTVVMILATRWRVLGAIESLLIGPMSPRLAETGEQIGGSGAVIGQIR